MRPRARNTIVQQWIGLRTYSSPATARRSIEDHDIVILGGGPAGLALTAALGTYKHHQYGRIPAQLIRSTHSVIQVNLQHQQVDIVGSELTVTSNIKLDSN